MTPNSKQIDSTASSPTLNRRGVLTAAAASAVVGFSALNGWVTEAEAATSSDVVRIPGLRGSVVRDTSGFTTDFGRHVVTRPRAVLRTSTASDVGRALRFCSAHRIPIAMNGQSGEAGHHESHSNYGQALTNGGLQVDARGFAGVRSITSGRARVGAGTTWAELVEAALATGQTVATLPDYLKLSVGGTISVGGVGGNVQRAGLCSDLVESIQIVTADGAVRQASRRSSPQLFTAALGGAGQYGIITEVTLALVPAHEEATITSLYYSSVDDYLRDQRRLLDVPDFDHHTGDFVRVADDTRWDFKIDLGVYHPAGAVPDLSSVLDGLSDDRARRTAVTMPYRDWAFRIAPFVEALSTTGHLEMKKPWVSFLLPGDRAKEFVEWVKPQMSQRDLGAGFCLLSPLRPSSVRTSMFVMPQSSDGTVFFFDLLAFPDPGTEDVDGMFERNRRFYEKAVSLGGKRYIIGAVPRFGVAEWRTHFGGRRYAALAALKRTVDPRSVLTPGQRVFS